MDSAGTPTPDDASVPYSHIFPIGYSNSSDCGYCRGARSGQSRKRFSYYAVATSLTPDFYQKLVDRCWRRSGTLLYRPNQKNSCCPHYTLRLDATGFKPTKDQRQAVNRFNKFVLGEAYSKEAARLCPRSREEIKKRDNEFDLVARVSESEFQSLKTPPLPAHNLVVTLEHDTFSEEKYEVFENYQRLVHKEPADKISRNGFKRFLCNSPLTRETLTGADGKEKKLGSYHQCYRLDGKLVAMGVLDLLPHCVSAVYFMYHESIRSHNPGKLGALREISLALDAEYRWWYSGFYIHSCPKMRYKVDYSPQYVLDPETLEWDVLDKEALAIFDKKPYVSLSRERKQQEEEREEEEERGKEEEKDGEKESTSSTSDTDEVPGVVSDGNGNDSGGDDEAFLFHSNMPGIPSLEDMKQVDMDNLLLRSDYSDECFLASQLVVWDTESIGEYGNLKSRIAELVAAIGPDLVSEFCVDFRRKNRM
ncbi:arginine-tRNA-protein transferase [Cercophora newfieldiana]|uniref:arginyltransferase n=1 Tax=Cercophora newfieldiana TaxID=92897 RepID=A0AA39YF03_9PEZI|nr:arginine-tRNA-protein transferase [Cercophora newfieldiana]